MIRSSIIAMLSICVACSVVRFVDKTSSRLVAIRGDVNNALITLNKTALILLREKLPVMQSPNVPVPNRTVVKCCCGKICKDARGLKMHQRSCQVIHGLNDELSADPLKSK
jgi:hypothetical protein